MSYNRLFYDADDVKDVTPLEALSHAIAAQRILGLMLTGIFDERGCIRTDDPRLFEEVAWRGLNWTEKAFEMFAEGQGNEPAVPAPADPPPGITPIRRPKDTPA
jgi:hypothetical protein